MKYIKKYYETCEVQDNSETIYYNEYVITHDCTFKDDDEFNVFLKNNIGQVVGFCSGFCIVEYKDIPRGIKIKYFGARSDYGTFYSNGRIFYNNEILHHSKNKKDLEPFIVANKFNL